MRAFYLAIVGGGGPVNLVLLGVMAAMKADWIAEMSFDCVAPRGRTLFVVSARIGRPILMPREGKLNAYGRCSVSLEPLIPKRWIGGENQFQALCLAFEFVRIVLKAFVAEGGRVYYHGTKNPIDLESPSFTPLATLADFTKREPREIPPPRRKAIRRASDKRK